MNKTVTIESKNHKYQNTYGGDIYTSDFSTNYGHMQNITGRILFDWEFDEQCHRNILNRSRSY